MKLYMAVTSDKYELPIAISDSPSKLGKLLKIPAVTISSAISHGRTGERVGIKFITINVKEDKER